MAELTKMGFQNIKVNLVRLSWKNASGNLYPHIDEKDTDHDEVEISSKKRKVKNSNIVIGPGESGGEALTVTDANKKMKIHRGDDNFDDEDDFVLEEDGDEEGEHSIAQKLALLSSALDRDEDDVEDLLNFQRSTVTSSNNFVAKAATTDSLLVLLRQALLANDDAQLEIALQVSDKKVIENSIMSMTSEELTDKKEGTINSEELIIILLTKLVTRISRKPSRAHQLSFWIRTVLVALISPSSNGSIKIGKREKEIAQRLAPLRNLLSERVESLPELLRLEGRLGLIGNNF
jgi:hypothetical protein